MVQEIPIKWKKMGSNMLPHHIKCHKIHEAAIYWEYTVLYSNILNTLQPSDDTWQHRSGSTLAEVMVSNNWYWGDDNKQLTWTNIDLSMHQSMFCCFHLKVISQVPINVISKMWLKITLLELHVLPHLWGANELTDRTPRVISGYHTKTEVLLCSWLHVAPTCLLSHVAVQWKCQGTLAPVSLAPGSLIAHR